MRKQEKAVVVRWIVIAAVWMAAVVVLLVNFYLNSIEQARGDMYETYQLKTQTVAQSFASEVRAVENAGRPLASLLTQRRYYDADYAQRIVRTAVETSGAYMACCISPDGDAVASVDDEGKTFDGTGLSYYTQASAEKSGYTYVPDDEVTGQEAILLSLPINYEKGKGYLFLYYPMDKFGEWEKLTDTFYMLLDREGNILASVGGDSVFLEGENLYSTLDAYDGSMSGKIKNRMKSDSNGTAAARIGEENRLLVFVTSGVRDWRFMMGVNETLIDKQVHKQWKDVRELLLEISGLFLLFIIIMISSNVIGKIRSNDTKKELEDKADTDLLTGLNNKLATERKISEFMEKNPGEQSVLFLIDIDNFKTINDTMGHAFGDEVLHMLGKQLSTLFRVSDVIGRIGGDEFMVFVKHVATDEYIYKEAKKIEEFFQTFEVGEYVKYSVTASIGAAVFPQEGADFEKLYKAADKGVYKAKKRGKKQLAFYDDKWDLNA